MLPNLHIPPLPIAGPIAIEPFGLLVGSAVVCGYLLGRRRARRVGLDPEVCANGMVWGVLAGFVAAHLVAVVFYFPQRIVADPLSLLAIWDGLSSFGGFAGGILAAVLYFRRKRVAPLVYLESILFGMVPAWVLGRLGCTIVFDHPGAPTGFFLGMADRQGIVRHNLGFYEMLLAVALAVMLAVLRDRRPFAGFHLSLVALVYAPARFGLDFLRTTDRTWAGLTAAQYFCLALLVVAATLLVRGLRGAKPASLQASGCSDAVEEHAHHV